MTNRETIQRQIEKCRRIMIPAMITSLVGFVASAITGTMIGGAIGTLMALITFLAFILWVSAILGIAHTVRCPSCNKRLGYLLLDPNYSKTLAPIGMPKDIPSEITECPYCHADLGKQRAKPTPAPYSPPAAGSESGEA